METTAYPEDFCSLHLPFNQGKCQTLLKIMQPHLEKLMCLGGVNRVYAQAASAADQWDLYAAGKFPPCYARNKIAGGACEGMGTELQLTQS